jgi:CheY-like chemotaxis protein
VLDLLDESANKMSTILNDVLSFQKMEEGKFSVEMSPFQMSHLLEKICTSMRTSFLQRNITFKLNINQAVPDLLIGDKSSLKQVVYKFLSYALLSSRDGTMINLRADVLPSKRGQTETTSVWVSVEYEGARIFSEEKQAHPRMEVNYMKSGVGSVEMGLLICKRIVHAHEGEMGTLKISDKSFALYFKIPFKNACKDITVSHFHSDQPSESTKLNNTGEYKKSSSRTIHKRVSSVDSLDSSSSESEISFCALIVDDVRSNRRLLEATMRKFKFNSEGAVDGLDAWEKCQTKNYHVILLDNVMPNMTGVEFAEKLRASGSTVPIIGITGNALEEDIAEFKKAGANCVLTKPIQVSKLRDILSQVCPTL